MNTIISPMQIGFMRGRLIYDNVLILDQILQNKKNKVICIDFEKAYDSISHSSIPIILNHLRFPSKFTKLITNMLKGSTACVKISNSRTDFFPILRGVKQGDPISPLLFNLAIEIISRNANKLISSPPILKKVKIPITMYADDINLYARTEKDIERWCKLLIKFQNSIGLKVNSKKSFTINCNAPLLKISESKENFRYLGFNFHPQSGLIDDFEEKINHTSNLLNRWFKSNQNIFNKLAIMKSYAMSHLWFKAFLLGKNGEPIEKIIQNFLWRTASGKNRTIVSKQRARQLFTEGGLAVWNMDTRLNAFKANLIEKIKFSEEMKLFQIFEEDFEKINSKTKNLLKLNLFRENRILNFCWKCWVGFFKNLKKENLYFIDEYNSIKELQARMSGNNVILTPRQQSYCSPEEMSEIFYFVKKIKHKKLANFLWLYFQGGLPIIRKNSCKIDQNKLCHKHIFQQCQVFSESLLEGIVISNILNVERPPSSEEEFWSLFSLPTKGNYLRKSLAALTFYNAWLNRNSFIRKFKIVEHMNEFVTQELDSIRRSCIERSSFLKEKNHFKIRWRINNTNWTKKHNALFFKHKTTNEE